jgi:ribosomal-protein-serine acetyltransferase
VSSRWRLSVDDHVELVALEPDDAERVFALVLENYERLRPWMPWVTPESTAADTRAFIEGVRSNPNPALREANGIYVDGELAGGMGLNGDPMNAVGEIGYWIAGAYEGRGVVSRSVVALVDYGFRDLRLHRIEIRAATENLRSRAIPERLGFVEEAVLREAGRTGLGFVDLVVYGMLAPDWAARER